MTSQVVRVRAGFDLEAPERLGRRIEHCDVVARLADEPDATVLVQVRVARATLPLDGPLLYVQRLSIECGCRCEQAGEANWPDPARQATLAAVYRDGGVRGRAP